MEEHSSSQAPDRWPWILWTLTTIALLLTSEATAQLVRMAKTLYEQWSMTSLPGSACFILIWFDRIPAWLPALALAVSGIPFARRDNPKFIQRWATVMILLMLILGSAILASLLAAARSANSGLSK